MSQPNLPGVTRNPVLQSRRGALGTLGLGALALLGSNSTASALFSRRSGSPGVFINSSSASALDLSELPAEWVARQGSNLKDYSAFLNNLRLQRLTPKQVIEAHAKKHGAVWNTLPPRNLWAQMTPTLRVIDRVAMELGQSVGEITSAYRSPSYNATCPGAKSGSYHQVNVAIDVKFSSRPSMVASAAQSLRTQGFFRGGIGRYPTFTHIDTRGQNVNW